MTSLLFRLAAAIVPAVVPSLALAEHGGHQQPPPGHPAAVAPCLQAQPAIGKILEAAAARLESARQTNDPAQLRAAVDQLQGVLRDLKTQLAPCAAAAAPADPHAGHGAPAAAPDKAVDPVCGMPVDPKKAPSATHEGTTYYFCSVEDRQAFQKAPQKYIRKKEG